MEIKTEFGRPVSKKTTETRRAVARILAKVPRNQGITAPEIARKTKKAKYDVLLALRYFHKTNQVLKVGNKRVNQPGRPADMYYLR